MSKKMEQVLGYAQATLQVSSAHKLVLLDFIPVGERLPEDDEAPVMILVEGCSEPVYGLCFYHDGQWCSWDKPWTGWADVTHWAEIPEIE